jgi:hypothetical protein
MFAANHSPREWTFRDFRSAWPLRGRDRAHEVLIRPIRSPNMNGTESGPKCRPSRNVRHYQIGSGRKWWRGWEPNGRSGALAAHLRRPIPPHQAGQGGLPIPGTGAPRSRADMQHAARVRPDRHDTNRRIKSYPPSAPSWIAPHVPRSTSYASRSGARASALMPCWSTALRRA